jgi:hypothetical protein
MFSVLLGGVPIVAAMLSESLKSSGDPVAVSLAHGQLLLPGVGICTGAVGRLIGKTNGRAAISACALCIAVALLETILFMEISSQPLQQQASQATTGTFDPAHIINWTLGFYATSVILAAWCVVLSER